MRSIDAPRERPAPAVLVGTGPDGEARRVTLSSMTLVVAVKPDCYGCREFVRGDLGALDAVEVVIVSAAPSEEWRDAPREVVIAPESMKDLEISSAPFYVLVDPRRQRVVREGVVFGPSQVAAEIADVLDA